VLSILWLRRLCAALAFAAIALCLAAPVRAQPVLEEEAVRALAPTGKLRVGVLMVWYFAIEDKATGALTGVIPDLARELARRLNVPVDLIKAENPGRMIEGFRGGALDVTIIGITADRAEAMDYGPVLLDLQTTYLVPAGSPINSIAEIDRPGVRILVPQRSAQEAHLKKTIAQATMVSVPVEQPKRAVEMLEAGQADAFSHVVPMLASAQPDLPGSRILPGSYYNVPIAIAVAKGRAGAAAGYANRFARDVKASGFVAQAIARAGLSGVVVGPP
jgi:polar amino acid transport system substrate-binding protein